MGQVWKTMSAALALVVIVSFACKDVKVRHARGNFSQLRSCFRGDVLVLRRAESALFRVFAVFGDSCRCGVYGSL